MALEELRPYLIEAVGRGEAPDISLLDSAWVAEFASRHYLQPPAEVDPAWGLLHENDFFPALLAANHYNGALHSVPITADVSVIWYRRDWLATEGLAPLIRQEIWSRLGQLKQTGLTILLIDKNIDDLSRVADQHYIIEKGRVVWHGSSEELAANPELKSRYLGI